MQQDRSRAFATAVSQTCSSTHSFAAVVVLDGSAVEFWPKASPSDVSVPLAVDHPVLVRSLERTRAQ
ncbi:hypothetical protein ADK67_48115, partial [Saccharothrix sp. NRRL B-16348]|uniref:hypothetical protein n=1 Tax=Saccharothrix sp. NRRL B-16348 TaxID=1415542 RepID=UPI0006C03AF3